MPLLILTAVKPMVREGAIATGPNQQKQKIVNWITHPVLIDTLGLIALPYKNKAEPGHHYENQCPATTAIMNLDLIVVEYVERIQYLANQQSPAAKSAAEPAIAYWDIRKLMANDEGAAEYGDYVLCIDKLSQSFGIIDLTQNIANIINDHAMIQRFMSHADASRVVTALSESQKKILMDKFLPPLSLRK